MGEKILKTKNQVSIHMSKVVVFVNLTLDGVMQAPGRPDEDTRGGFKHGGWAAPYAAMPSAGEFRFKTVCLLIRQLPVPLEQLQHGVRNDVGTSVRMDVSTSIRLWSLICA